MIDKEIELIVKSIFTKMFNADFSACEYGIECYKKGMEYQGIKELAIENDNLIKQVKKLESQIEGMKCCANCKYYSMEFLPYFCIKRETPTHCTGYCDKWEIKE